MRTSHVSYEWVMLHKNESCLIRRSHVLHVYHNMMSISYDSSCYAKLAIHISHKSSHTYFSEQLLYTFLTTAASHNSCYAKLLLWGICTDMYRSCSEKLLLWEMCADAFMRNVYSCFYEKYVQQFSWEIYTAAVMRNIYSCCYENYVLLETWLILMQHDSVITAASHNSCCYAHDSSFS